MREIKFKAWDSKLKRFSEMPLYNPIIRLNNNDIPERDILLQYTGIKDKNGIEIYEGDILKVYDDFFREGLDDLHGIVKFNNGRFYLNTFKSYPNECWVYFEVVGNVYENEDLLEVK